MKDSETSLFASALRAAKYKSILVKVLECHEHGFTLDSETIAAIRIAVGEGEKVRSK